MAEQPKPDRTSVTISKRVHRELVIACARLAVTQKVILEGLIEAWLNGQVVGMSPPKKKED